jgi:hypothetical protein
MATMSSGLRLHFKGFDSWPDGNGVWDLQVDTPRVGFVTAPDLATAITKVEALTGRNDWKLAEPMLPDMVRC